jgi:hypothetical protein
MKKTSICFVIPYFGHWPFWMPFFLESCRRNPDIDWYFFSDCGRPDDLPDNVCIRAIRDDIYISHASDRLGIGFYPAVPCKLRKEEQLTIDVPDQMKPAP